MAPLTCNHKTYISNLKSDDFPPHIKTSSPFDMIKKMYFACIFWGLRMHRFFSGGPIECFGK